MRLLSRSGTPARSKPLPRHHRDHRRVAVVPRAAPAGPQKKSESDDAPPPPLFLVRDAARRTAAASTAALLSVSALLGAPTFDARAAAAVEQESSTSTTLTAKTYRLPVVSPDPEVLSVQRVLLQAWDIVDKAFVDGSFGGRDMGSWRGDLVDSLDAAAGAGAAGGGGRPGARLAELAIDAMLERLDDPYTRRMPARDYEAFRQSSEGEIAGGVGLLIAAQPVKVEDEDAFARSSSSAPSAPSSNGDGTRPRSRLVVLSPIEGGPAARAGIRPGDEVLAIDGRPTDGFDGESAAGLLRGPRGSSVVVDVARREVEDSEAMVPGISGRAPRASSETTMTALGGGEDNKKKKTSTPRVSIRQVRLRREKVELSPVTSSVLTVDGEGDEASRTQKKDKSDPSAPPPHRVGYLRLASFNARAAPDTARALSEMRAQGAEAFVLDLRGNGGGLVRAAVDVSRALLPRGSTVFAVQGRSGENSDGGSGGSGGSGRSDKRRHSSATAPPASPLDVVGASSGIPATAVTQRVVLDDEEEEKEKQQGGAFKNSAAALSRLLLTLPRLLLSSGPQQQQQQEPSSSSSSSPPPSSSPSPSESPLLLAANDASSFVSPSTPLAVLVDRNSASASEILAGALRDNGRAALVGERTFGKGKIQSVFPLRDGSALFVTVARYMTPSEELIDGVGIKPENACRGGGGGSGGGRNDSSSAAAAASTLLASLEMVPGVPSERGALQASLSADPCVLTAERLLLAQVEKQQKQGQAEQGERGL